MRNLKDKLRVEEENLNLELEESHGDPNKMKVALEKKINLYIRFLKEDDLSDLDRLHLENKREWALCHHLILILEKENSRKITDLTKRVYKLEKAVQLD
jgi:hypothetical protein